MAGEDVVVKIGGDLSPIQRTFAQVKIQAAQAGEAAGVSFGDRTAYMAEQRVRRGMQGVIRSLATAKDPIDAISGAVEGLGQSFRIVSSAFIGFAIGTFLKDQLEQAAAGAQNFYTKTDDIFALANNSSKAFTEKAIKNFEDAKAAYGKEGFFEWLIYGAGQKETLKNGEAAYQDALKNARAFREAEYKAEADTKSTDETTRIQGEVEKINERYQAEIDKANEAKDSIVDIERARDEEIAAIRDKSAKKDAERYATLQKEIAGEVAKQAEDGKTPQQKLQDANNKVAEAQTAANKGPLEFTIAGAELKLELEKAITEQKKAQAEMDKTSAENVKKFLEGNERDADVKTKQAQKSKEEDDRKKKLIEDQASAASSLATAQAEAMGFHGPVSSLRREGFGRTPTGGAGQQQLKAMQASEKHLATISTEIAQLNAKIGGGA